MFFCGQLTLFYSEKTSFHSPHASPNNHSVAMGYHVSGESLLFCPSVLSTPLAQAVGEASGRAFERRSDFKTKHAVGDVRPVARRKCQIDGILSGQGIVL